MTGESATACTHAIREPMTFESVPAVLAATRPLFDVPMPLIIDLQDAPRADSAALALLVEWRKLARERQVSLSFRGVPANLVSLVSLSGLDDLLKSDAA